MSDSKSASPMIAQTSHPPTRNLSGKTHAADGGGPRDRAHSAQEASKMASGRPKKPPRRPLEGSQGCGHLFLGRKNYLSRHTTRHRKSKCQELRDSGDNPPGRRPEANRGIVWRATRRSCLTTGSFGVRELNRKKTRVHRNSHKGTLWCTPQKPNGKQTQRVHENYSGEEPNQL